MPKVDLELALLKAQNQTSLNIDEVLTLLDTNDQAMMVDFSLDVPQIESVRSWVKQEAQRFVFSYSSTYEDVE